MVGIVVEAQRLNRTRLEFGEIFGVVGDDVPGALRELKGSKIFYGRDGWRQVAPKSARISFAHSEWLSDRKHHLAMSAIDVGRFNSDLPAHYPETLKDLWVAGAVHIALQLQRLRQGLDKNKGHTVIIFDENKLKADKLNEVLFGPPEWTDPTTTRPRSTSHSTRSLTALSSQSLTTLAGASSGPVRLRLSSLRRTHGV